MKTSIKQAKTRHIYNVWSVPAFKQGFLLQSDAKSKKGAINLKPLQYPVNHDDNDGQPYLTISYTSQGFNNIFRMWWINNPRKSISGDTIATILDWFYLYKDISIFAKSIYACTENTLYVQYINIKGEYSKSRYVENTPFDTKLSLSQRILL
jgi:hypothetical protein